MKQYLKELARERRRIVMRELVVNVAFPSIFRNGSQAPAVVRNG